jgi:hypothetical protein
LRFVLVLPPFSREKMLHGVALQGDCHMVKENLTVSRIRHSVVTGIVFLLSLLAATNSCWAQAPATARYPALVVSVSGISTLLDDLRFLARSAGMPQFAGLVTLMTEPYTQGVDVSKPTGMLVTFDGSQPTGLVFVAVSDFASLLQKLSEQVGQTEDLGGGVWKVAMDRDAFLKQHAGWVFAASRAADLEELPNDPTIFLGDMPRQYTLGVRVDARGIPDAVRSSNWDKIRSRTNQFLDEQLDSASAGDRLTLQQARQTEIEDLISLVQGVEQLTVGWGNERAAGKTFLEVTVVPRDGSELAEQLTLAAARRTTLGQFHLPEAALSCSLDVVLPTVPDEQVRRLLQQARRKLDPQFMSKPGFGEAWLQLTEVIRATMRHGNLQAGCVVVGGGRNVQQTQFVAGAKVAEAQRLCGPFRTVLDGLHDHASGIQISWREDRYGEFSVFRGHVALPPGDAAARRLFGERLQFAAAIGVDRVYWAHGPTCIELLQGKLDEAPPVNLTHPVPVQVKARLRPLLEIARTLDDGPATAMMAAALRQTQAGNRVRATVTTRQGTLACRLEAEAGALQLIGEAAKLRFVGPQTP